MRREHLACRTVSLLLGCVLGAGACSSADYGEASTSELVPVAAAALTVVAIDSSIDELHDLAISNDGLWAHINGSPRVVLYDWSSGERRPMVLRGMGPREAIESVSLGGDTGRAVVVWDARRGRLLRVDATGQVTNPRAGDWLQSALRGRVAYFIGGTPNQVASIEGRLLVGIADPRFESAMSFRDESLFWADSGGLVPFLGRRLVKTRIDSMTSHGRELAPFPVWSPCGTFAVADYDPSQQMVFIVSPRGDTLRRVPAPRAFPSLSREERRLFGVVTLRKSARGTVSEAQLWRFMRTAQADSAIDEYSSLGPAYVDLRCSSGGDVWLNRFELTDWNVGRSRIWDWYRSDGTMMAIQFPDGFRLYDVNDSMLAGATQDSVGIQTLQTLRLAVLESNGAPP